jgi:phosphatidylglycerol---prolipoprotein diacylglyceryl transferase
MRPVLFRWRGMTFWAYPTFLCLGLVSGVFAGNAAAHAIGLDAFRVYVATLALIPAALVGARLLFVACNWTAYRGRLGNLWNRNEGGAAQYGGLVLAIPLSFPLLRLLGVPFGAFWDVSAFTILIGMILTRIGCLLNGCCAGRPSDSWLAVRLPNRSRVWTRRIPTQCLEAAWAAALAIAAAVLWNDMPFGGALFAFVAGGYACGRLVLESLRELPPGCRFTAQHAISIAIVVTSAMVLSIGWK